MRPEAYAQCCKDLNRLVFAAEAIETPAMPDALLDLEHLWKNSPTSFEVEESERYGDQERTIEAAEALGLQWQALAVKLYEACSDLDDFSNELDDFSNELDGLRDKAKEARLAMIALDEYDPTTPTTGAP